MSPLVSKPKVRVLCVPDIDKPIGGVKQLYRHVESLTKLGWDAAIVTQNSNFVPSWFDSTANRVSLDHCFAHSLSPNDLILVLPETYLTVNFASFYGYDLSLFPRVIFNQNAYYSFGNFDSNTTSSLRNFYHHPLLLHTLSVSVDTHLFLRDSLGILDEFSSRIVNSIEPIFIPSSQKQNLIHWMPRKNPDHVNAILQSLNFASSPYFHSWTGQPLESLAHSEIASKLSSAKIFLSFGHPEGFGLPIAEAMAAGCWVIGYSGNGGRELFGFGASTEIPFGDWNTFLTSIVATINDFALYPRDMSLRLHRQSLAIQKLYSSEAQDYSIKIAWDKIYSTFLIRSRSE